MPNNFQTPSPFSDLPTLESPPVGGGTVGAAGPSGGGNGTPASGFGALSVPTAPPSTVGTGFDGPPIRPTPSPPIGGPPPGPEPKPRDRRWHSAFIGAVAGALAAVVVGGILYAAVEPRTETVVTRASTEVAGESLDIQALLGKVRPSVVSIKTDVGAQGEAAGSGIVLSTDGQVLTNAHVIEGATDISVSFADGSTKKATLIGSFPGNDVALIQAEGVSDAVPAELGDSSDLLVGDEVVAIGNALNLGAQPSVTKGIVSALDRDIQSGVVNLSDLIQTDAAINPGNSGGPLINAEGQVVGVNTAIIQDSQNIGFSLSINSIRSLIDDIRSGDGEVNRDSPFLGVVTTDIASQPADVLEQFDVSATSGAFIADVQPGSAAERAGLEPGDVLVEIGGEDVGSKEDVGAAINDFKAGDTVDIVYERLGRTVETTATLGRKGG